MLISKWTMAGWSPAEVVTTVELEITHSCVSGDR